MLGNRGYISRVAVVLFILILFFVAVSGLGQPASTNAVGVQTQLCFILDGSGSISSSAWTLIVNGLADAVENPDCFPQDGSVELTVVQFGWHLINDGFPPKAELEIGPIVVTSTNAAGVANDIRHIEQAGGATPIACGINLGANTMFNSPNFNPNIKQAINLVTDGKPTCVCDGYTATSCGIYPADLAAAEASAEEARSYALSLFTWSDTQDEFDAEFIGTEGAPSDWLRDYIVWPQPGYIAPPFNGGGWVRVVPDAQTFAETVCEKIAVVIAPILTPTPTPCTWNFPHGLDVDPMAVFPRRYDCSTVTLAALNPSEIPVSVVWHYYEATPEWQYFIPGSGGALETLENGNIYLVIVKEACTWEIPYQ